MVGMTGRRIDGHQDDDEEEWFVMGSLGSNDLHVTQANPDHRNGDPLVTLIHTDPFSPLISSQRKSNFHRLHLNRRPQIADVL